MAGNDKRYLDEHGLYVLADEGFLAPHPVGDAKAADSVKVGRDAYGHVILGDKLKYSDLEDLPTIGDGKFQIQVNGKKIASVGGSDFSANTTTDHVYNLTAADFGLAQAMQFIGITDTDIKTEPIASPVHINGEWVTPARGNVVLFGTDEYLWDGTTWTELGGIHGTESAGAHAHTVEVTVPASTFATGVSTSTTKVGLDKKTQTVVTSVPGASSKLETTAIRGVDGTTTVSRAVAGSAVDLAAVGAATTVALRATDTTKVGNADVGAQITITGVNGSTTASFATAGQAVDVAKVGAEVEVAVKASGATTVVTGFEATNTAAYIAEYKGDTETLMLTPTTIAFTPKTTQIYGVGSTTKITPAAANGSITPYTFTDITVPKAATQQVFNAAKAVSETSTEIYGVGGVATVTSAVSGAKITPYTFEDVNVAVSADSDTTVATGGLNATGAGAAVMTGLGTIATATVLADTTAIKSGASGDVEVISNVSADLNEATSLTGSAAENGAHTHPVV